MSSSRSIAAARQKRSGETVQKPQQFQSPPQQMQKQVYNQKPQMKPPQQAAAAAPRPKLSIGDAFGLVTLRLGRVEQFMFDVQQQGGVKSGEISIPENSQVIDKSVFTNMISRLDGLEKKESNSKQLTILENELRSTKDLLISMMAKFDKFSKETDDKFKETDDKFLDYDSAIAEIEEKMDSNEETGEDLQEDDAVSNDLQSELIGEKEKEGISFEISE
jgi:molecular chaperone DnaK (HSP70)